MEEQVELIDAEEHKKMQHIDEYEFDTEKELLRSFVNNIKAECLTKPINEQFEVEMETKNTLYLKPDEIAMQVTNKDKEDYTEDILVAVNKQTKEPDTGSETELNNVVGNNDGRLDPLLEMVDADPLTRKEKNWTNYLKEVLTQTLNPLETLLDPLVTNDEESCEDKTRLLKCKECNFITEDELEMEIHIGSVHTSDARFECAVCDYRSFFRHDVENHSSQIHRTEEHRIITIGCVQCYNNESHEQCNIMENENEDSIEKADEPMNTNSTMPNKCDECDYTAKVAATVNIHVRTVHRKEVRYSCDGCEYKSFFKSSVTIHQNHVHDGKKQRVIGIGCPMCEEGELHGKCDFSAVISSKKELKGSKQKPTSYIKGSKGSKKEPKTTQQNCPLCDYETTKTNYARNHQKLNHDPNSDVSKVIKCTQCEYETVHKKAMDTHKRAQHMGETKYCCDICGFKSFFRHYVSAHVGSKHKGTDANIKNLDCLQCQTNLEHDKCQTDKQTKTREKDTKAKLKLKKKQTIVKIKREIKDKLNKSNKATSTKCQQCNYYTENKNKMTIHMR